MCHNREKTFLHSTGPAMRLALLLVLSTISLNNFAIAQLDSVDPLLQYFDDKKIKVLIHREATQMLDSGQSLDGETLINELESIPAASPLKLKVNRSSKRSPSNRLRRCYRATVVIATQYDCGKCNKIHLATAGGVLISRDGVVATNYHVIETEKPVTMVVMTVDGKIYPVTKFIAGSEADDTALIRIKGNSFECVELAEESPLPLEETMLVSHPQDHFYTSSRGSVSRYSTRTNSDSQRENWMEITNEFCKGSSGCGVFNNEGELVGLVSQKSTMTKKTSSSTTQTMTVYRCVPLDAIRAMLE